MNKKKAIVCTLLFSINLIGAIIGTMFIENEFINLYELLSHCVVVLFVCNHIEKFYNWLVK